ncbi:MAG: tetratricopeptide repeat protein [Alphaproteobacteria bacterium]|nr:tetratricopeptide repeat protein [Alphaproteobacteria bacterium]
MNKHIEKLKAFWNTHIVPPKKDNAESTDITDGAERAMYREINEELHAQKLTDFVMRYMRLIIIGATVIVISVVGWQISSARHSANLMQSAAMYESAIIMMFDGNAVAAHEQLMNTARTSRGGMRDIALFSASQMDIQMGNIESGTATLENLRRRASSRDFRDLATLHLAMMRADEMTPREFESFMSPLLSKRSPFYFTGLLLVAKKHLSADDYQSAIRFLNRIVGDANAPVSIRAEAEMLR